MRLLCSLLTAMIGLLVSPADAMSAFRIIDVSVKEVYEDNINPLLSGLLKPGRGSDTTRAAVPLGLRLEDNDSLAGTGASGTGTSDFYTVLSAAGGVSAEVGIETEITLQGEVSRNQFSTFTELNGTSGILRALVFKQFSDMNSAQVSLSGRKTGYQARALNGDAYAATFDIRQQLSTRLWLSEGGLHERYNANASVFSYVGRSLGIRSGYRMFEHLSLDAGYSYLVRKFESGAQTKMHAQSVSLTWHIARHIRALFSGEHQSYSSSLEEKQSKNNLSSIGIAFSY